MTGSRQNQEQTARMAPDRANALKRFQAAHLIRSLRANYNAYVKNPRRPADFCAITTLDLPSIKEDSQYKPLEPFIHTAKAFFDGDREGGSQKNIIIELTALEERINESYEQRTRGLPFFAQIDQEKMREEILLEILLEFEAEAGFSTPVLIEREEGLIPRERFEELVLGGHPFNDAGATEQHGPHSHRVQSYLLHQYLRKHPELLPTTEQIQQALVNNEDRITVRPGKTLESQITSIFYKLTAVRTFNSAFNWDDFKTRRQARNEALNPGKNVPQEMDGAHINVQFFDRRGYAGYFSVPSTFGHLQKLGLFKSLPTLGKPNFEERRALKHIFDLTKPAEPSPRDGHLDYLDLAEPPSRTALR
jgi:hypothetical protein